MYMNQFNNIGPKNGEFKINLFDTPGIDRYHSLQKQQVKKAHGIVIMFDLTDKQSFESIEGWFQKLQDIAMENIPIILVGNKVDLVQQRQVSQESIDNIRMKLGIGSYTISAIEAHHKSEAVSCLNYVFDSAIFFKNQVHNSNYGLMIPDNASFASFDESETTPTDKRKYEDLV